MSLLSNQFPFGSLIPCFETIVSVSDSYHYCFRTLSPVARVNSQFFNRVSNILIVDAAFLNFKFLGAFHY